MYIIPDRDARNKTATLLKRYATGHITNDELADNIPSSDDPAIKAIDDFSWTFYDDLTQHYAKDKHKLSKTEKKHIARCILFLKSNHEYTYPKEGSRSSYSLLPLLNLLTLGLFNKLLPRNSKAEEHGDLSVWPFVSRKQLNQTANLLK